MHKPLSIRLLENARGALTLAIIVGSLLVCFIGFLPPALAKLAVPNERFRRACSPPMTFFCRLWFACMAFAERHISRQGLIVDAEVAPSPRGRYLLIGNHQSWADILILLRVTQPQLPFPRFFIKQELIWVPLIGFATWALDMPYMKRYSKEQVRKNPALRGADMETTRRKCEVFRHLPSLIINYPEGTRFSHAKRDAQGSPYRHLLKPRVGGCAFIIEAMGDLLDGVLDLTIVYRGVEDPSFWDYCCGRLPEVRVSLRRLPVPEEEARRWIARSWAQKDRDIETWQAVPGAAASAQTPQT